MANEIVGKNYNETIRTSKCDTFFTYFVVLNFIASKNMLANENNSNHLSFSLSLASENKIMYFFLLSSSELKFINATHENIFRNNIKRNVAEFSNTFHVALRAKEKGREDFEEF